LLESRKTGAALEPEGGNANTVQYSTLL